MNVEDNKPKDKCECKRCHFYNKEEDVCEIRKITECSKKEIYECKEFLIKSILVMF